MNRTYHLLLLLLLAACQREDTVDLQVPFEKKLVCAVFLEAGDSMLRATVFNTIPVDASTTENDIVPNALVRISGSSGSYVLNYDDAAKAYYTLNDTAFIKPGNSYRLQVEHEGQIVTGSTTIPQPVDVQVAAVADSSMSAASGVSYHVNLRATVKSSGGRYLRLFPLMVYKSGSTVPMYDQGGLVTRPIKPLQAGESISQDFTQASNDGSGADYIKVLVLACDEAYVKYYNSSSGSLSFFDPTAFGNPGLVYSNLSSHIGVIGSYTISKTVTFGF